MNHSANELKAAFDEIASAEDWRGPIGDVVPSAKIPLYKEAVEFFTATELTVHPLVMFDNERQCEVQWVESVGYRAGPAGDH